jgi:hypothetical protein
MKIFITVFAIEKRNIEICYSIVENIGEQPTTRNILHSVFEPHSKAGICPTKIK